MARQPFSQQGEAPKIPDAEFCAIVASQDYPQPQQDDPAVIAQNFAVASGNGLRVWIQDGPRKEVGVNGIQVDWFIAFARAFVRLQNERFPCRENSCAITKLDEALLWLQARTSERTKRLVEGTNQA